MEQFHKKMDNLNHIKSFFWSKIKYTAFLSGSSWVNNLTKPTLYSWKVQNEIRKNKVRAEVGKFSIILGITNKNIS